MLLERMQNYRDYKDDTLGDSWDAWESDGWQFPDDGTTAVLCPTCAVKRENVRLDSEQEGE